MKYTLGIGTRGVNGAVDDKACRIDRERVISIKFYPVFIDLYQAGRGYFLKHQAVGVNQKLIFHAGDFGGDVGEHQIIPAVLRNQPITGGEVNAGLPFFAGDFAFYRCNHLHCAFL